MKHDKLLLPTISEPLLKDCTLNFPYVAEVLPLFVNKIVLIYIRSKELCSILLRVKRLNRVTWMEWSPNDFLMHRERNKPTQNNSNLPLVIAATI